MTYHMKNIKSKYNRRIEFDPRVRFPVKLWDVANDTNTLIQWEEDGNSISKKIYRSRSMSDINNINNNMIL